MNLNELILNVHKSVENLRHLKMNMNDLDQMNQIDFTHYVRLDILNKNVLLGVSTFNSSLFT